MQTDTESVVRRRGDETSDSEPSLASQLSKAVVRTYVEFLGRGPTRARAILGHDLVTVLLEDTLTKAEHRLLDAGHEDHVVENRRVIQNTMRPELVAAVEQLTGRTVVAFLSDHQAKPDYAIETFVLAPAPAPAPESRNGAGPADR